MEPDILNQATALLKERYSGKLLELLKASDCGRPRSLVIDFSDLIEWDSRLLEPLFCTPLSVIPQFDAAIIRAQHIILSEPAAAVNNANLSIKTGVRARFKGFPRDPDFTRDSLPRANDFGKLLCFSGTVIRVSDARMVQASRLYECKKCKHIFTVLADYSLGYALKKPKRCSNPEGCQSQTFNENVDGRNMMPDVSGHVGSSSSCRDYQEIKVQEHMDKLSLGAMPQSVLVTLEEDLVDTVKPGDRVDVNGIILRRWKNLSIGRKPEIERVIQANYIVIHNKPTVKLTPELRQEFLHFWQEHSGSNILRGRNLILESFCPQIFGLYLVKLALMVVMTGGVEKVNDCGTKIRGESHILLVGDPGTAKSQFLRYASKLSPRAVLTTGIGSTSAGLTVTAQRDGGEWHLEAGALVLADGGICCIDEFNSIREADRASIHEAMEQQTISVAKAGIVSTLKTRCTIIAATNPKPGSYDSNQPLAVNVAMASPLLSRFDLILTLVDQKNEEWDRLLSGWILKCRDRRPQRSAQLWSLSKLQAYLSWVKEVKPVMSLEADRVLCAYYTLQRKSASSRRVTIRSLESLIRLCQAHARLVARPVVALQDAVVAIILMECSSPVLLQGINTLHTAFPKDPQKEYLSQCRLILTRLGLDCLLKLEMARYGVEVAQHESSVISAVIPSDGEDLSRKDASVEMKSAVGEKATSSENLPMGRCFQTRIDPPVSCTLGASSKRTQSLIVSSQRAPKEVRSVEEILEILAASSASTSKATNSKILIEEGGSCCVLEAPKADRGTEEILAGIDSSSKTTAKTTEGEIRVQKKSKSEGCQKLNLDQPTLKCTKDQSAPSSTGKPRKSGAKNLQISNTPNAIY